LAAQVHAIDSRGANTLALRSGCRRPQPLRIHCASGREHYSAPFDAWLAGDDGALDERQRRGLARFLDTGLMGATGNEADRGRFRVEPLRNAAMTAPYFRNGSVAELGEAIAVMA